MKAHLIIQEGRRQRVLPLKPVSVIGRQTGNTVRIPSSAVSRQHCRLTLRDGLVFVEDLGSVNGTFLNGRKLVSQEVAQPGDELEVGPVKFVIDYEIAEEAFVEIDEIDALESVEAVEDGDVAEAVFDDDRNIAEAEALEIAEDVELVFDEVDALDDVDGVDEVPELEMPDFGDGDGDNILPDFDF